MLDSHFQEEPIAVSFPKSRVDRLPAATRSPLVLLWFPPLIGMFVLHPGAVPGSDQVKLQFSSVSAVTRCEDCNRQSGHSSNCTWQEDYRGMDEMMTVGGKEVEGLDLLLQ